MVLTLSIQHSTSVFMLTSVVAGLRYCHTNTTFHVSSAFITDPSENHVKIVMGSQNLNRGRGWIIRKINKSTRILFQLSLLRQDGVEVLEISPSYMWKMVQSHLWPIWISHESNSSWCLNMKALAFPLSHDRCPSWNGLIELCGTKGRDSAWQSQNASDTDTKPLHK